MMQTTDWCKRELVQAGVVQEAVRWECGEGWCKRVGAVKRKAGVELVKEERELV